MDTRDWVLLAVQIFLTGLITYIAIAFWAITASGYTEGLQVVGFAIGSALITITAFVIGLPLRIVRPARRWWFRHGMWFPVAGIEVVVVAATRLHAVGSGQFDAMVTTPAVDLGRVVGGVIFPPAEGMLTALRLAARIGSIAKRPVVVARVSAEALRRGRIVQRYVMEPFARPGGRGFLSDLGIRARPR